MGAEFPVVYLARPHQSVVIEAYRHLIDPFGIPRAAVKPRTLYTVTVTVAQITDLTDLTDPATTATCGLSVEDLESAVEDCSACQHFADAAHHLDRHGILAPAATRAGQTLVLFVDRITVDEQPVVIA